MKTYKPTSPSQRSRVSINYREYLTGSTPFKSLVSGSKRHVGRNNHGRITVRHKGGGHKKLMRDVDFVYNKIGIPARVETVEYDPTRTGFISLICYADGERRYILAPKGVKAGMTLLTSPEAALEVGNRLPLNKIPVGTFVYNVELQPLGGAKLGRSAGNFIQVVAQDEGYASIKLPSGEVRKVLDRCYASIGSVSNDEHHLVVLGKAGRNRWKGVRPTVRGTAMNAVDHPHGGGEGRQGVGLRRGPKTREGKQAFGVKTRTPKKYSNGFIVTRRKSKRDEKGMSKAK
jgi:large subunit ribosomal protein L2